MSTPDGRICWVFPRVEPMELPVCVELVQETAYYAIVRIPGDQGPAARTKRVTKESNVFFSYGEAMQEAVRRAHESVNTAEASLRAAKAHLSRCIDLCSGEGI